MARILLSAVVVGLLTAASPQSQEKEIVHPASGVFVDTLKDPETKKLIMRYKMRVPEKKPERKHLGLIIGFHGMNGN